MSEVEDRFTKLWYEQACKLAEKLSETADRIQELEVALRRIKDLHDQPGPEDEQVIMIRDDMTYFIVCETLGETP